MQEIISYLINTPMALYFAVGVFSLGTISKFSAFPEQTNDDIQISTHDFATGDPETHRAAEIIRCHRVEHNECVMIGIRAAAGDLDEAAFDFACTGEGRDLAFCVV